MSVLRLENWNSRSRIGILSVKKNMYFLPWYPFFVSCPSMPLLCECRFYDWKLRILVQELGLYEFRNIGFSQCCPFFILMSHNVPIMWILVVRLENLNAGLRIEIMSEEILIALNVAITRVPRCHFYVSVDFTVGVELELCVFGCMVGEFEFQFENWNYVGSRNTISLNVALYSSCFLMSFLCDCRFYDWRIGIFQIENWNSFGSKYVFPLKLPFFVSCPLILLLRECRFYSWRIKCCFDDWNYVG